MAKEKLTTVVIPAMPKSVKALKKNAELGSAMAAEYDSINTVLGRGDSYYNGRGITEDKIKAAEQGHVDAQYDLGNYYCKKGINQDFNKAIEWYKKAAEQDDRRALRTLADCYYKGKGVAQDYRKAVELYLKVAPSDVLVQTILGDCYYYGCGVSKDFVKAVEWYAKAAEMGCAAAQYALGCCYYKGFGVKEDHVASAKWFEKASAQGHSDAQELFDEINQAGNINGDQRG
jgi:hypothetical protein